MKKRIVAAAAIALIIILGLTGCAGKSAYEVARDNGFVGTEQEWLESLKGKDGIDAQPIDFYDLWDEFKLQNPDATFADFLQTLSINGYNDAEYATAIAIRSAVSIFCTFAGKLSADYRAAGAGVAYRTEGDYVYIITNYHVVYDRDSATSNRIAKTISVYSYGLEYANHEVSAEFVGGSITKDIAVIKAKASDFSSGLAAAAAGDSGDISLGEKVVAIGNPSAEGISVSAGVISVDSENITMEALDSASKTVSMRVIRTDTAINKGNSGGGLFNARGQLIGIVNAKTIQSGVENIGFAIPVSVAKGIADCVVENDSQKCLLGINATVIGTRTYYNGAKNRVEIVETVSVDSVTGGSLAAGKIFENDKLLSVSIGGGESFALTRLFHLSDFLYKARKGDIIHLEVERNGESITVDLTPAAKNFTAV